MMKKLLSTLLFLMLLFSLALAEGATATVSYQGVFTCAVDAEYIDMGNVTVTDMNAFVAFLKQLPNLKQVDMFATKVEKRDITLLEGNFPDVKFGWTIHLVKGHYIRTDQTAFSTLHGSCDLHQSSYFELLKYCPDLLALDIGHNDLSDISFLRYLPKLRVLILACNERVRNLSVLSELHDLEYLELFSCNIVDITPLKDLEHLMDLNISYNNITKYSVLNEMTQLKRLWIPQSGVPCTGPSFKKLQADLPNTLIMNQGHPTNYGWREGNHYETIYTMFRANEYIPFEDSYPIEGVFATPLPSSTPAP